MTQSLMNAGQQFGAFAVELGEEVGDQLLGGSAEFGEGPLAAGRHGGARGDVEEDLADGMGAELEHAVGRDVGRAEHPDRDRRPDHGRGHQSPLDRPHHLGVLGLELLQPHGDRPAVGVGRQRGAFKALVEFVERPTALVAGDQGLKLLAERGSPHLMNHLKLVVDVFKGAGPAGSSRPR